MFIPLILFMCLGFVYQSESCDVTLINASAATPSTQTSNYNYKLWMSFDDSDEDKWNFGSQFSQIQADVYRVEDDEAFNKRVGKFSGSSLIRIHSSDNDWLSHTGTGLYVRFKVSSSEIKSGVDVIIKYGHLADDLPSLFLGYDRGLDRVVFKTLLQGSGTDQAVYMSFDAQKEKWIEAKVTIDGTLGEVKLESVVGCDSSKETNMKYLPAGTWNVKASLTDFFIGGEGERAGEREQHTTIVYNSFNGSIDLAVAFTVTAGQEAPVWCQDIVQGEVEWWDTPEETCATLKDRRGCEYGSDDYEETAKRCMRTCNFCHGCYEKQMDCHLRVSKDFCLSSSGKNCPVHCGFCKLPCEDINADWSCKSLTNECSSYGLGLGLQYCPKYCGLCTDSCGDGCTRMNITNAEPPHVFPQTLSECQNTQTDHWCAHKVLLGQCDPTDLDIIYQCRRTCNFCHLCVDFGPEQYCSADSLNCTDATMNKYCQKSCDKCPTATNPGCIDRLERCQDYTQYCSEHLFANNLCPVSCNKCSG